MSVLRGSFLVYGEAMPYRFPPFVASDYVNTQNFYLMSECILSSEGLPFEPTGKVKECSKCGSPVFRDGIFCDKCISTLLRWSTRSTQYYVDGGTE